MTAWTARRRLASAQELLPIEDVLEDVVLLRNGECRAVLQAGCVNFALKSAPEQEAILAAYRRFLNGLTYPLQLLVRVVPTDVEAYLRGLQGDGAAPSETLARLARDHEAFVRRIARERTLLDRRFYVVVPSGPAPARSRGGILRAWRRGDPARARLDLIGIRRQLGFRCAEVAHGLAAVGISTRRLDGDELTGLWRSALAGTPSTATVAARGPAHGPVVTARAATEVNHG